MKHLIFRHRDGRVHFGYQCATEGCHPALLLDPEVDAEVVADALATHEDVQTALASIASAPVPRLIEAHLACLDPTWLEVGGVSYCSVCGYPAEVTRIEVLGADGANTNSLRPARVTPPATRL